MVLKENFFSYFFVFWLINILHFTQIIWENEKKQSKKNVWMRDLLGVGIVLMGGMTWIITNRSALGKRLSTAHRTARRLPAPPNLSPMIPFTATATYNSPSSAFGPPPPLLISRPFCVNISTIYINLLTHGSSNPKYVKVDWDWYAFVSQKWVRNMLLKRWVSLITTILNTVYIYIYMDGWLMTER